MASANTTSQQLYDLLVSRDFDPSALNLMGKPAESPADADLFSFEYKTENKNYGTVVILIDSDSNMEVYFGDNLGKTMETDDRKDWYDFLYMIRMLAKRNMKTFSLNNLNKLKYNMKTIAAMTEGTLLEGYYGTSKTSYSDQPKKTKLVIKHSRPLGEGEQRFRNIQSLFIETEEGERFKLPFTNLTGGKAMARHIAEGGKPYDAFGQHIAEMMAEMATLSRFNRATRNKTYVEDAQALAEQAVEHYRDLKRKAKRMISRRGYYEELENFDPITVTELDETVDAVRETFVHQSLDPRVEDALPILARIQETNMKEVDAFESWANEVVEGKTEIEKIKAEIAELEAEQEELDFGSYGYDSIDAELQYLYGKLDKAKKNQVTEGTGRVASTPQEINQLKDIMSEPLPVGADALNASETIGFLLGGDDELQDELDALAAEDPNADARPVIQSAIERLGIELGDTKQPEIEEVTDIDTGEEVLKAQRDPMLDDVDLERLKALLK